MSRDELHSIAITDSPQGVEIPKTLQGLIVWAVARFGVGILVAGVFGFATKEVYTDMREDRIQLMDAYRDNTKAIQVFSSKIESLSDAINEAHMRANR